MAQSLTSSWKTLIVVASWAPLKVLEKEIVAMIGPQSSVVAHVISQIVNGLQIPQVSYAATDPTLSTLQLPFFLRTTVSDSYQMAAMADLIDYYGWKEVIAIFLDDDYGRNGISFLGDELQKKMCRISHEYPLPSLANLTKITQILNNSKLLGPRVYVVHVGPDPQLRIFTIAHKLGMLTSNYIWFATDWLSTTLDSSSPITNGASLDILNGVVGLRPHTPESKRKRDLWDRLRKTQPKGLTNSVLNVYGLYAYDSVWIVAKAVDKFIKENGNIITFSSTGKVFGSNESGIQLGKLKVFDGGSDLLRILMQTDYNGLSGRIQFGEDRNVVNGSYDVINIDQRKIRLVGYWSNNSRFKLENVVWPGGKSEIPRGWVIADAGKPLRIAFPKRASFVDFVTQLNNTNIVRGYVIDIFKEALKFVPYEVPYKLVPFGDGRVNPSYDELVQSVANNVFDAAVGDIAIVTNRTKIVDFSQPYTTTGLIMVAPVKDSKSSAWVFLKPFTVEMWCATAGSFVVIGIVIWMLEHRINDHFRGPPKRQIITMCLFSFSTLFKANQEATISPLSRLVMLVWLFLLLVITSSYTASLTSILTLQQLWSPIRGIDDLVASNLPIGYQVGSFAYDYLTQSLFIPSSRLKKLDSPEDYEKALRLGPRGGGVAAIIDELPYLELFLSKTKEFGMIGQPFTRSGWGFAFQRGSRLAVDMSTAILRLSESGKLQEIHNSWFCKLGCPGNRGGKSELDQLHLISFWGLYLLCGIISLAALFLFLLKLICQYIRYKRHHRRRHSEEVTPFPVPSNTSCTQTIQNFIGFIDEREEAIKSFFRTSHGAQNGNQLPIRSQKAKEKADSEIEVGTSGMNRG
ncbi:glutamate receptor 3.7-like isoform X2 [Benincasa hispida]|uniref:glutamate receptor 3.7-like isoform X2 n=1 Tax=Benincasa hispida TaxID=102211 RepID=UPI001901DB36|nr:glutamate receptor 3.7-like isoform X2 [Benincasa hispida]